MVILFTKQKFDLIKKQYESLQHDRKEAVAHVAKAREMGDLSENGYYKSSKAKLSSIDFNLRKLSYFIKCGKIIDFKNKGIIEVGCIVTLKTDNKIIKYQIVGKEEADPTEGKISNESPLGKALLQKKEGETIILKIAERKVAYQIIKVE